MLVYFKLFGKMSEISNYPEILCEQSLKSFVCTSKPSQDSTYAIVDTKTT